MQSNLLIYLRPRTFLTLLMGLKYAFSFLSLFYYDLPCLFFSCETLKKYVLYYVCYIALKACVHESFHYGLKRQGSYRANIFFSCLKKVFSDTTELPFLIQNNQQDTYIHCRTQFSSVFSPSSNSPSSHIFPTI